MENHHFQWVNPLFLWPFSSSLCYKLPEGIYIYTYIYHQTAHSIPNFLTALLKQRGEAQQIPERRHDVQLLNDTILSIKVGKKGAIVEDPNQLLGAVVS